MDDVGCCEAPRWREWFRAHCPYITGCVVGGKHHTGPHRCLTYSVGPSLVLFCCPRMPFSPRHSWPCLHPSMSMVSADLRFSVRTLSSLATRVPTHCEHSVGRWVRRKRIRLCGVIVSVPVFQPVALESYLAAVAILQQLVILQQQFLNIAWAMSRLIVLKVQVPKMQAGACCKHALTKLPINLSRRGMARRQRNRIPRTEAAGPAHRGAQLQEQADQPR